MSDTAENSKHYYWLRLKEGFFDSKHIKFLRCQENGDHMCIVYLKLQLKSLRSTGVIQYEKLFDSLGEEIAFDLDEPTEIVNSTLKTLEKLKLLEHMDDGSICLPAVREVVGKETKTAERMRNMRSRKNPSVDEILNDGGNPFEAFR